MIVAGEASGDRHGANLVRAMADRSGDLFFVGVGGRAMREAGVRVMVDADRLSVVGITEVIARLPEILKGIGVAKGLLRNLRPDLLILIDFPDFNLHLAATARRLGVPVLYYISPQIWAWRAGRVRKIGRRVDHMAVILPFEERFYRRHHIPVTFVGHPLSEARSPRRHVPLNDIDGVEISDEPADTGSGGWTIGLLPGSRSGEIAHHLPLMLRAAHRLAGRFPEVRFLVSVAGSIRRERTEEIVRAHPGPASVIPVPDGVERVLSRAHLVVAASGTVTLETAMYGVPMVIIYRVSPLSYWLGRLLIRVKHISLVNLILDGPVVPELIQNQASPTRIADAVADLLADPRRRRRQKGAFSALRNLLGEPGADLRVARIALDLL